ncbi:NADH:flavin oxidoreductase/NADH oxidase [Corynebacterium breve]|uniref:NADH:flavin oxidoreductase/NADH oxidase n=1 Tax=Corynebacterium breve TaxID=3049799 RepID=A0ABY8VEZ1_9CORY|nr:NADH:flavin oxidoreductase/NADH oxidase [Corynebacterium breve]WIM67672.1 NADH:flavin oxidoreductase/NADH oxidase [Corynebacterium breve]
MTTIKLAQPMTLRELTVRNRAWVPPMCQYHVFAQDGVPEDWHLVHYGALVAGGFGLIIAESTAVVPEGRISPMCTGLWNDEQTQAWKRIVDFVHSEGGAMGVQLNHAGRKASTVPLRPGLGRGTVPEDEGGWQTVAPSPIAADGQDVPRELTLEEVQAIPGQFAAAARRAVEAGFDTVELHAAHGYLLHQFLSPVTNKRDDDYGGAFEGRTRLLLEVVDAVRAELPAGVPLLVRLSATDWLPEGEGWDVEQSVRLAELLLERGVDLMDISTGGNVAAKIPVGPGYQVQFADAVRKTGMPTAAVGLITDAPQAEQVLADGAADAVLIGRAALRNPGWATNALHELGVDSADLPMAGSYFRAW